MLSYNFISTFQANSCHEHLAIGDEQAIALYKKNPNDPAIVNWENALQSKLDIIDVECSDFTPALYCYDLITEARNDCLPHLYIPLCEQYVISPLIQNKINPDTH